QISRIECGTSSTDHLSTLIRWAQILHIPADKLWFRMPDNSNEQSSSASHKPASWHTQNRPVTTEAHTSDRQRTTPPPHTVTRRSGSFPEARKRAGEPQEQLAEKLNVELGDILADTSRAKDDAGGEAAVRMDDANRSAGNDLTVSLLAASLALFTAMAG